MLLKKKKQKNNGLQTIMQIISLNSACLHALCAACDIGWAFYEGACYKYDSRLLNFAEAQEECAKHGALVSSMKNREEQLFVMSIRLVGLFVGCLASQQHISLSQGRIYSDNCTCCHTELEVADQTLYLFKSQYTDTRRTSPSADPITPAK